MRGESPHNRTGNERAKTRGKTAISTRGALLSCWNRETYHRLEIYSNRNLIPNKYIHRKDRTCFQRLPPRNVLAVILSVPQAWFSAGVAPGRRIRS